MAKKKEEISNPVYTEDGVLKYVPGTKILTREFRATYPGEAKKEDEAS